MLFRTEDQEAAARPGLPMLLMLPAAILLAGCAATVPDDAAPRRAPPPAWHAAMAGGLHSGAAEPDAIAQWWRQLGDPSLSAIIDQVLGANTDLRTAQTRLREARARRAAAGALLFPAAGVSAAARRSSATGAAGAARAADTLYVAGFDASWEIDIFGANRLGVQAAQAELDASAATAAATRVSLVAEAAQNYIEARTLQLRADVARRNLASQTETWQLTEWRTQAGLASSLDAEQARANLEQTRAQLPRLDASLAAARNRLAVLAGEMPGTAGGLPVQPGALPAIPAIPARVAVGIPADALRRRPDVHAAEYRLAAETARLGAAHAARYPRLSLTGSIGIEALSPGALGSGTRTRSFAASLASPVFDAGRLARLAEAQDAVRQQAAIAYEAVVLAALEEVENALVLLARSRERESALRAAEAAARNAAVLARERYAGGLIDFRTVLDTERTLLAVEDSRALAQSEGASSLVQLYKALGGGWTPAMRDGSAQGEQGAGRSP